MAPLSLTCKWLHCGQSVENVPEEQAERAHVATANCQLPQEFQPIRTGYSLANPVTAGGPGRDPVREVGRGHRGLRVMAGSGARGIAEN